MGDFGEALLQRGAGSNESIDDGDVVAGGESGGASQQRLLAESGAALGQPQHPVTHDTCQPSGTVAAMGLRPDPGNALSPPFLVRGERLVDRQTAERLRQHQQFARSGMCGQWSGKPAGISDGRLTVGEYLEQWLENSVRPNRRASTYARS